MVYMNTVVEHLPDPTVLLKNVFKILKPGGLICVVSPNDYNPLQKILKEKCGFDSWWVAPPQHINYFDFKSVERLLQKIGFKVVESLGTFPVEFFLLSGENYVGNNAMGRICHARRKKFEETMYVSGEETLNAFYRFLAEQGIGRQFVVIAKK